MASRKASSKGARKPKTTSGRDRTVNSRGKGTKSQVNPARVAGVHPKAAKKTRTKGKRNVSLT